MAVKGLRNLCRAPYIYLVVSVILLIMILAGMMFYKNSKEGFKEGANSGGNSSQECDPPCGNINNQNTCVVTPASTPSGYCYWNTNNKGAVTTYGRHESQCATYNGYIARKCKP